MKTLPNLPPNPTLDDVTKWIDQTTRTRNFSDVVDASQMPSQYVAGRRTTRVPTDSTDVQPTDRENDVVISTDGTSEYKLTSVNGTLAWRMTALGSF